MNNLEQKFYNSFKKECKNDENELCAFHKIKDQFVIGIYKVDFVVDDRFVIEIDGYEWHKTKEQRESDYKRERYLLKNNFIVIRFTGTEIFLSCKECVLEALHIIDYIEVSDDAKDMASCVHFHQFMKEREAGKKLKGG